MNPDLAMQLMFAVVSTTTSTTTTTTTTTTRTVLIDLYHMGWFGRCGSGLDISVGIHNCEGNCEGIHSSYNCEGNCEGIHSNCHKYCPHQNWLQVHAQCDLPARAQGSLLEEFASCHKTVKKDLHIELKRSVQIRREAPDVVSTATSGFPGGIKP